MTQLLDLPVEILEQIVSEYADPDRGQYCFSDSAYVCGLTTLDASRLKQDLAAMAALCRTCHALRQLSEPFLFSFMWLQYPTAQQLVSILRSLESRPERAKYVRRLVSRNKYDLQRMSEEDMVFVNDVALKMALRLPIDWQLSDQNIDLLAELIALQAVNIERMEMQFCFMAETTLGHLLPDPPANKVKPPRFANLRHLSLGTTGHCIDACLQHILKEAPNLVTLETENYNYTQANPIVAPKLTRFVTDALPSDGLVQAIRSLRNLEHFEIRGIFRHREMIRAVMALADYAASLKSLSMVFRCISSMYGYAELPLEKLTSLESLTTNMESLHEGRVMQSLPPSLRRLRLVGNLTPGNVRWIKKQLTAFGQERFPGLVVYLAGHWSEEAHLDVAVDNFSS